MEDDAQRAIKEVREYEGEKIFVTVAKKKPDDKKKKKKVKQKEVRCLCLYFTPGWFLTLFFGQ